MNPNEIDQMIKASLAEWLPKESNKAVWALSKTLGSHINKAIRDGVKKEDNAPRDGIKAEIQKYMENPMSEEEESKILRATLHAELAAGTLSPQLLDKLDKIIGINTGEETRIEVVDFSVAFPDLDHAIRISHNPKPEV